jgi:hypothetical protein
MPDLKFRLREALAARGHAVDDDILEELAGHASAAYEAARADGLDGAEAERRINRLITEWCADADRLRRRPRRVPLVDASPTAARLGTGLAQDVRYGIRTLRRAPGFAFVAAFTMALGIGATATLFSVTYGVLAKPRLYAVVLIGFGTVALVIAGVGLFGVLSYTIAHRVREFGVRTALGARTADIVALVVREAVVIWVGGAAAGLGLAFALARYVGGILYGITPHDALTYALVPMVLLIVAVVACVVPARRAASIDPLQALRST